MNQKKGVIINFVIFLLILISVALLVYFNLDFFNTTIRNYVERYGYIGILFFSFLADVAIQPIGPEIPAIIGVVFKLDLIWVIAFALIGSYIASLSIFYLSRKYFRKKFKNLVTKEHYDFFSKHGKWALVLAAITPVPWVAMSWIAGSLKMRLRQFVLYGLIPRTIRIVLLISAAWYASIFV